MDGFLKDEIQFKLDMPRWLSLVERVIRNLDVEGSNPSRGFAYFMNWGVYR